MFDSLAVTDRALPPALKAELRGWALLAAASMAVAGLLAVLLVLSRTPKLQELLPWAWQGFFFTALVTHVVFLFIIWFLAGLGVMTTLAAARAAGGRPRLTDMGPVGLALAWAGAALLLGLTLANAGEPSLNNYVPVLNHPGYFVGLGLLAAGVALPVLRLLATPGAFGRPVEFGTAMCGLAYLVALACFLLAWARLPAGLDAAAFNERVFWGGGHVLQFVNTGLMLTIWCQLAEAALGRAPLPPRLWRLVMASLVAFVLPGPVFTLWLDPLGHAYRTAFTDLLWYGLTPAPVIVGAGLLPQLARRPWSWRSPAFLALVLSLMLFLFGGVFGFFLGVGDTRTPSHYHAVIGGVNLALMGLFLVVVLPLLGRARTGRTATLTLWLYGIGQTIWSSGMFIAGAEGVPRKTAGAAQGLDSLSKVLAMGLTGAGGLVAVIGGVLFVWLALAALMAREARHG